MAHALTHAIRLPPTLHPRQRAALHAAAEAVGVPHASTSDGAARCLVVGEGDVVNLEVEGDPPADAALAAAVRAAAPVLADALDAALVAAPRAAERPARAAGEPKAGALPRASTASVDAYVSSVLPLLAAERAAELEAARAALSSASSRALAPLILDGFEAGFLGRTSLTLVSALPTPGGGRSPLPAHRVGANDLVEIRGAKAPSSDPPLASGVVARVRDDSVVVAVDSGADPGSWPPRASLRVDRLANDVTHKRLVIAVRDLEAAAAGRGPAAKVVRVLFGVDPPPFSPTPPPPALRLFDPTLDHSQATAVATALAAGAVAVVHGPPGTGKSTTLVEIVRQLASRGARILLTAPSNVAVDTLVERLVAADPVLGRSLVRLGHPARALASVAATCLDARVAASDAAGLAADARSEARAATAALAKLKRGEGAERRRLRGEVRALAKEARARDKAATADVVARARVVASTLTGLSAWVLGDTPFDVAVVDEAAQAVEPAAWAALARARACVLAGDHKQLPPTIVSEAASAAGLGRTLFERAHALLEKAGGGGGGGVDASPTPPPAGAPGPSMLTVQYRMHASICEWASSETYGGRLTSAPAVAARTLAGLLTARGAPADPDDDALAPLLLIDTAGCDCDELMGAGDESRANPREAAAVWAHAARLLAAGLADADLGVIAPYAAQVALLRGLRPREGPGSGVEVATVDGFQGREKEAVIISATRSNPGRALGFLADARRFNVAVTRGRRHVALVCDADTLAADPFLGRLVAHFSERGVHESAQTLLDEVDG